MNGSIRFETDGEFVFATPSVDLMETPAQVRRLQTALACLCGPKRVVVLPPGSELIRQ